MVDRGMTSALLSYIKNDQPCIFVKYGDGEYLAANYHHGANCDRTPYTLALGLKLRESFKYLTEQPNSMIGNWHSNPQIGAFWQSLTQSPVNTVDYHTVLIDSLNKPEKLELFRAIKESRRKKLYVCNPLLKKSKILLDLDVLVPVDFSDWFQQSYQQVLDTVSSHVTLDSETLIMTSAGMGAKALIADLHKKFPKAIYIDIGSGLDTLCTKRDSRGYSPPYEDLCKFMEPILPESWNSEEYESIYQEARMRLGVHL